MDYLRELKGYLTAYDAAVQELQEKRRAFDGLLGLGNHPGNAACHEILDRQVAELCQRAAGDETLSSPDRAELIRAIFMAEQTWKGPEYARLMLVAVQRHTLALIPGLDSGDRKPLADWYQMTYPRRKRVPAQDQVLKALMA